MGFRDGDDAELGRWAAKQRSEHRGGQLAEARRELLLVSAGMLLSPAPRPCSQHFQL